MFEPKPDDFWRGIVLYGENQTTYKMALRTLLMNYANQRGKNTTKVNKER